MATLTTDFQSLAFAIFAGDEGPYGYAKAIMEPLEPNGVDGRRWRQRARRHQSFQRTGYIGAASYASAITACDTASRIDGSICTLDMGNGWRAKVMAVLESCRPVSAPLITAGQSYTHHAIQVWTFTAIEDGDALAR